MKTQLFYQSFLDLLNDKVPQVEILADDHEEANLVKMEVPTTRQLANGAFREVALAKHGKTVEMIKAMAPSLANAIKKPQRLLHDDEDYYVAIDTMTDTYYCCYRQLLMIDIDFYKDLAIVQSIVEHFEGYCKLHPSLRFKLYKSRNGIHAFLVSQPSNYKADDILTLQLELQSDFYYIVYSYLRGWSVRLNKKTTDTKDELYEYICDVGQGEVNEQLVKLVTLHVELVTVFKHTAPNTMFGN
jgi:hypothetical protein